MKNMQWVRFAFCLAFAAGPAAVSAQEDERQLPRFKLYEGPVQIKTLSGTIQLGDGAGVTQQAPGSRC